MTSFASIKGKLAASPVRLIEPANRPHSAVAMILKEGPAGLEVLLIERATHERDLWSGHIGLPGGKVEPEDNGAQKAAERETLEELGLDIGTGSFLGQLRDIVPGGLPIVVSCFVYGLSHEPHLRLNAAEVADAFWFPLMEAANPKRSTNVELLLHGRKRIFPAIRVFENKEQPLWGITYRLLKNFKQVACN